MPVDITSIIICAILVIVAIMSVLSNPFFRKVKDGLSSFCDEEGAGDYPKVSIVVIAHKNPEALDAHLPLLLSQDYPEEFEVIVVGERGDLDTETVIGKYANDKKMYATYIPQRSLFMSKTKLAIALGVKASHNEWILLLDAESMPQSTLWMKRMALRMTDNKNLVIGYSNYSTETSPLQRFLRLRTACYQLRCASRNIAYRSVGTNIAFRRSEFISNDGYRGNLQFVGGEYDFLVNKYARQGSTAIATEKEATVHEDEPTSKTLHNKAITYTHIRKYLKRSTQQRLLFNTDMSLMYLNYIADIGAIIYAAICKNWIMLPTAIVCLIATVSLRMLFINRTCKHFEEEMPIWQTFFYELAIPWINMGNKIRYAKSDKHDFTTHKI